MSRARLRHVLPAAALVAGAGLPVAAVDFPPAVAFSPASEQQAELELAAGPAADALTARAACDETRLRSANVGLTWTAGAQVAVEQRVDVSKFRDGFATGRFEVSAPLGGAVTGVTVEQPEPGVAYYWRVVARTGGEWVTSDVARFEVPICPWDPPDDAALPNAEPTDARDGAR